MPRALRTEYPGAIYHVMNRGDRRALIFRDDLDHRRIFTTLAGACLKTDWQVHVLPSTCTWERGRMWQTDFRKPNTENKWRTKMNSTLCSYSGFAPFGMLTNKRAELQILFLTGMLAIMTGCSNNSNAIKQTVSTIQTNPVALETTTAGDYLLSLHQENRLPGASKDISGNLTTGILPTKEFEQGKLSYPFSRTFHIVKTNDPTVVHYTVGRASKESEWQLQRAWKTDSDGKVIEEWFVK